MSAREPVMPAGDSVSAPGFVFPAKLAIGYRGMFQVHELPDAKAANSLLVNCRHQLVADGPTWYGPTPGCPLCGCWFLAFGPGWKGVRSP